MLYSTNFVAPQAFQASTFASSSSRTPNDPVWGPYIQNTFGIMGTPGPPIAQQYPPLAVEATSKQSMGATERAIYKSPESLIPPALTLAAVPIPIVNPVNMSSGTVDPKDTTLAAGTQQLVAPVYQLGELSSTDQDVEMTLAGQKPL